MPLFIDPQGNEIRALKPVVDWKGKDVLEVGCGDGRLTQRLAAFGPRHIEALDPDPQRVKLARRQRPAHLRERITYRVADARTLKFRDARFDVVVFAWSL